MTNRLAELFERADLPNNRAFNRVDLADWGLEAGMLPFLAPATTPEKITCQGCEEACFMPFSKQTGQISIWCDRPQNLGLIRVQPEELDFWQIDMQMLANVLAGLLGLQEGCEIIPRRAYDLGTLEGHTLFLLRGGAWNDGQEPQADARIRNASPLLITLSPLAHMTMPVVWIGQLLDLDADGLHSDRSRITLAAHADAASKGNVFRKTGDYWLVRFEGKETLIKHSNGMVYLDYLLHKPNQNVPALTVQVLTSKAPPLSDVPFPIEVEQDAVMLGPDPMIDDQTRHQVKAELARLKKDNPNSSKIPMFEAYLSSSTFQGKSKGFVADNEKARLAITKAINSVIERLKKTMPNLGNHLEDHIHTGRFCTYMPTDKEKWG